MILTTFGSPKQHRDVWRLAWPMILSNISLPLLTAVDTALLGHLENAQYLGAVAVGGSILTFIYWSFGFLRMGTTSLNARAFGAEDANTCRLLLGQSTLLALALAIMLFSLQGLIFPFALSLMDPSPAIRELALAYTQIRIFSAPATLATYAIVGWFIGLQNTRAPLLIMLTTNILNILLDFLLIIGLDMNSEGAALATVTAEYAGLTVALYLIRRELKALGGKLLHHKLFKLSEYRPLLLVNRHLFVRTACLLFSFSFFTAQGARQGDELLAANAIILQLIMLTSYGLDGFAHASEALIGKSVGRKELPELYAVCRTTTFWALLTAILFTLLFAFAKLPLIGLFSDIEAVSLLVRQYYFWVLLLPLISVWSYQLDGIFIGAGKTQGMQNSMLFSCFIVYIPLWWLTQSWGNHGLWLAFCAFNLARTLSMSLLFHRYSRSQQWFSSMS